MKPDYIFETSWEVCNKIGGIYTVVSTKAKNIVEQYGDKYLLIGPDVWKETTVNPDFIEDHELFAAWKIKAHEDGLKVRTGRWNIAGNPLVILVDFSGLFGRKDEIFARFWETYKLDSLHGGWDYIEPALFGYAAGQVIRHFTEFTLDTHSRVVAHFHEWMSAAGILYLKSRVPAIGTVFTTHATMLGRSVAGRGLPLYSNLAQYPPEATATNFQIISKHSLESIAAREADTFTTVSGITAKECEHFLGRNPDLITTNGFEKDFVPKGKVFDAKREKARRKAFEIASTITGRKYADDTMLVITSGRYEFRNKGIDLFISSLGEINRSDGLKKDILAFITVPADHRGPANVFRGKEKRSDYLTHKLNIQEHDPVLRSVAEQGLLNRNNDRVHLIFVPAYLNGNDGVIDLEYYDFLPGFDLSVFPSYYEPWGYTPLESIAFKVPTITTRVAGFGNWVEENFKLKTPAVKVIERSESNDDKAIADLILIIKEHLTYNNPAAVKKETQSVLNKALWDSFVNNYYSSWDHAAKSASKREPEIPAMPRAQIRQIEAHINKDRPEWKKVLVKSALPDTHSPLKDLAFNLWWSWNNDATELFEYMAGDRWYELDYNPVKLLESLSLSEFNNLKNDPEFSERLDHVIKCFKTYMDETANRPEELVAYFSMEFGLQVSLQIYSGGLGILAGDYLKQASDSNKNMIGVGLLYRHGYFKQVLSLNGDQVAEYRPQKFTQLPLVPLRDENGDWIKVKIALPGRFVTAKAWQVNVGRIHLYLLDTDINENSEEDRKITSQLYGGDRENRIKQEMILGIGGVRMIEKMGLNPDVYHLNEGHSAFSSLERIRSIMDREGLNFHHASEVVKSNSLFTTHTPVPAGHDTFEEHLMRAYLSHFCDFFKISWEEFIGLGRFRTDDSGEKFSMSVLAAKLSQEINGVSKIHGEVSREMFRALYPGYYADEIHIGHVTNGVHYFTWTDNVWQELYRSAFGEAFEENQPDASFWEKIYEVPDEVIWKNRLILKNKLIENLKIKQKRDLTRRHENPKLMLQSTARLDENTLIIGFARRFATYKRAHLLFTNLERLSALVNNADKPVVFLFAGKAHPNDKAGQDLIKRIVEISKIPEFVGRIIFLEDYDMTGGKLLTNCVDIWLNTPTRPLEASGTSGEKAIMNGVLNFSVLDGWWAEGYRKGAGWAIEQQRSFDSQQFQDELDAEIIYNTFEQEIVPVFYEKDKTNLPRKWIGMIKKNMAEIAPRFTMQRMLNDYYADFYTPLLETGSRMRKDGYSKALELVVWKDKIRKHWDNISVDSLSVPDSNSGPLEFGSIFEAEIVLNIPELTTDDLGVEIVMGNKTNGDIQKISFSKQLEGKDAGHGKATFTCSFPLQHAGVHDFAFRIYPKHQGLKYRMDFPLVKWV